MLLALQFLAAARAGDEAMQGELLRLPEAATRILEKADRLIPEIAREERLSQYVFLGHGPYYGLACEAMLKTKEMARTPAEAYHTLELMHGPRYALDEGTLVTLLLSEGAKDTELALLPKIKALGARLLVLCERAEARITESADFVVELASGLSEYARLPLLMPVLQLFAYERACSLGREVY
jgi:glucosamine--fructose-6-phosphate aminotransferase (isomerizing)